MPTILAALNIDPPGNLPGIDLLDEHSREARHTIFGSMHSIHNMTVGDPDDTLQYQWCIDGQWKLMLRFDGKDTTRYKNVHRWDREPVRLYNLATDPHETNNLAGARPDMVRHLTEAIDAWRRGGNP